MATRSIGDIQKTNGQSSLEEAISPLASHADANTSGESADNNELSELGQKIFLDRYALKDMHKRTLAPGDMVIVCVDDKTGQREIGIVRSIDERAAGGAGRVEVELRDGAVVDRLSEHVSKPIETEPEQMMERVARGVAAVEGEQADEWYHKFRWLLNGWKFVPAGRILTAAGTDQQLTFYNCMPPEQEILTADGYKPIAEVNVGDLVVTHRNRLRPVLHKFERETEEPVFIIKAKKLGYDDLRVTGEHKVLAIRSEWVNTHKSRDGLRLQQEPQWIPAKELRPGDFVAAAYNGQEESVTPIYISEYVSGYQVNAGKLSKPQKRSDYHGYLEEGGTKYEVNDRLIVDRDLCYLFGRWLGDGCVTHRTKTDIPSGIKIVFALDEREEAERVADTIKEKFGVPASIKMSSTERWLDLWANSMPLGQFFKAFFGCYSYGKSLPSSLRQLPDELTLELLKGIFTADGYISDNKLGILLANRKLSTQIHQLLMRLGYFFSIKENTHKLGRRPAYRIQATANECGNLFKDFFSQEPPRHDTDVKYYFEHEGLRWVRINGIAVEDYSGMVFDIEVNEDHSFVSAGLVVSNCYVIPSPKDSRRGIVDTLSQMMEIMSRGGGVGINVSSLRPRHSYVKGVNGRSSGSVSWGALYSFVTGLIEQGGCLTPDTLVFTEDGLLRLDEIVRHQEKGWREQPLTVMTDEGNRLSRQVFNNGVAEVLKVKTDMGLDITGTPNHKVKVMTDTGPQWRRLDGLHRGDAIMVKLGQHAGKFQSLQKPEYKHLNQDVVELPDTLDEELAFFLGYMAGDGFVAGKDGDWRLGVAVSHDSYLIEEMPNLINRLFKGVNVRVQQKENDASLLYLVSNRAIREFLAINDLAKARSAEARVPRLIRQSPPEVLGAFLRGLFEADGSISHGYPILTSASKQLVDEAATLLIGLGCPVKVEQQARGEGHYGSKPVWRLRIHSFKGLSNWKSAIGCDSRSRFAACLNFEPDMTREMSYRLPHAEYWIEPVLAATALPQIDHRATGQRFKSSDSELRRKLLRYMRGDRNLTLSAYAHLSEEHEAFAENAMPVDDTWFVFVESVQKAGESLTLDLEVEDNHTYLANGLVTHNSRRGALMIILNCWHPDVTEFINSKREMGKITNANISVGITDKFMEAVHADGDWDLVFPDVSDPDYEQMWDGNLDKWLTAGKRVVVHKTVKAREIWDSIIESAWASAEPGVYFIERSNKMSNSWYYDEGYLGCTNPCLTGDTLVSTPDGWRRVDTISEGEIIATVLGRGMVETVEAHEKAPVFKVTLSDGATLRATAAHRFHAIKREDRAGGSNANKRFTNIRLDELQVGDYVRIAPALMPDAPVPGKPASFMDREYGFALGVLLGDGCYTANKLSRNTVTIACDARESEWADIVESVMRQAGAPAISRYQNRDSRGRMTNSLSLSAQAQHGLAEFVASTLLEPVTSVEKDIPLEYINTNREFLAGLLDGLWSTDGNVNLKSTHPLLRLKSSSEKLVQSVRRILLMFDIHGRIVKGTRSYHEIGGRRINETRPYYELIISGAGVKTFAEQIGITHPAKADQLKRAQCDFALTGNTWLARIASIEPDGEEAVYDLYEPESDTWITDGVVNQGCGEQPLPGFGVCNLGAINLSKFVRDGDVAWEDLGRAVRYAVRFLDDVIDATPYFFDENFKQQQSERRVGLNTMGLAEMLIRLGIRYGSDESAEFIEKLYHFIATEAYSSSSDIAAEKGPFPLFDAEKFLQSGYMQQMPEEVREAVRQKGVRNVTLLTQAPNGCVTPDTLVFADGALRPIATLGDADGPQWQEVSFATHSDSGSKAVDKFYVNGYHDIVEIVSGRGFNLAATLQHRVRVIDGEGNYEWKQMGDLQPGDTLVMVRGGLGRAEAPRLDNVTTKKRRSTLQLPETMTPELAELMGFYVGDGYLKDRRGLGIAVSANDSEVVGRLQELIGRTFNLDARVDDTGRNCLMVWAGSYFIPRWMRANGLAKNSSIDAHIPEAVLAGGAQTVAAFLRGLFESDGSISSGIVTLVTSSERLARETQIALLGLGIVSTRRSIPPGEGRYGVTTRHEVRVLNSREVLRFREAVGFVSNRKQELLNACEDKGGRGDSIPTSLLRKLYAESEGLPTGVRQEIAGAIKSGMAQERWRTLASANPDLGKLPSAYLLDGRLFFDVVAGIDVSHSFTFDLSVPDTNTYTANGIVAHNTIGTMAGTSTGIEPFYFWTYLRKSRLGQHEERVKVIEEWQQSHKDEPLPDYFVTAMDLAPEEHVKVQAAIQRWVDSSISKTCNLPNSYTVEQTRAIYDLLYRSGCKGGTIYRDGSRDVQVLNLKEEDKKKGKTSGNVEEKAAVSQSSSSEGNSKTGDLIQGEKGLQPKVRPRPYKRRGYTVSKATPSGTAHITMNEDEENQPFEVFVEIGKAGSDIKAMAEAMGRLMSLTLRMASPVSPVERVREIVKQITGIGGARSYGFGKRRVLSLPDAVGQALAENYLGANYGTKGEQQGEETVESMDEASGLEEEASIVASVDLCPNCGDSAFVRQEGCQTCIACGYSEC